MISEEFRPVIRFFVASDTHVRDDTGVDRIKKALSLAYEKAREDGAYKKLDAAVFAGDLSDSGTESQFDAFADAVRSSLKDETEFLGIVAKGHDSITMGKKSLEYYEKLFNKPTDFHFVIGSFHFIGISTCKEEGIYYVDSQREFLKKALDEAIADDLHKPVFVFHHEHVKRTVFGSSDFDGWGHDFFNDILFAYPQIVDFSGHSHYPLNDPRSIWQGEITAVGTGALFYAELTVDGERKIHPEGCDEIAQFWLVEVDGENNVRLRGFDALTGSLLCERLIENPADGEKRQFTPALMKERAKPPCFQDGAKVSIKKDGGKTTVEFPPAASTDGEPIFIYRLTAFDKNGEATECRRLINPYWNAEKRPEVVFELESESVAAVSVTAENCFGMKSDEICY